MIASVYIKDGNIHIYNEENSFSGIGGLAYELGRPLLDFVCCEPERFSENFSIAAEAFDNEYAHIGAKEPIFLDAVEKSLGELQQREIYIFFYSQMLIDFIYDFIESPRRAIMRLDEKLPGTADKLRWAMDFEWPASKSPYVQVMMFADKEKRLFRAAMDVVELMSEDLRLAQEATIYEIELLLALREKMGMADVSSMEYLYMLEEHHRANSGKYHFIEKPFRAFYGVVKPPEIVELYEIDTVKDLIRFEFVKMIEQDIFIKKCKNCERFFIPRGRSDVEYCNRVYGDSNKKCSENGAMLRYEKKVAENPVLEAHKKAYRRFHSRTRAKKMTQAEFMRWYQSLR